MKNHLYKLVYRPSLFLLLLVSLQVASQKASISYPFAVGLKGCTNGDEQIHFYKYNSTTNNISSITSTSGATGYYTPLLKYGSNNTQRFSSFNASISYNPKDKNIYYLRMVNSSGSWRTYAWSWPIGTKPASSGLINIRSFNFYILGVAFDAQGKGYMLEFSSKAPYVPILRSIDFNTGAIGGQDILELTGGAVIYEQGSGDVAITPSGQMFFVVDNKLFSPDYKNYTGTGKKLTCTYIDTVVNNTSGDFVGLTYADGETISAYYGSNCPYFETNPVTAATTPLNKVSTVYTATDLATVVSGIGAAKRLVSVTPTGTPQQYDVVYEIVVKNYGNYDLSKVQVTDDLTAINGAANLSQVSASFVSNPAGLKLNAAFNGGSDQNLLTGLGTLPNYPVENNTVVIRISCRLSGIEQGKIYYNRAKAEAAGFNNDALSDLSTNGSIPDLNNNDKPDDIGEDQPTPLLIGITAQTPPCATLGTILYKQDFGSGATIASLPFTPTGTTQYTGSTAQPLAIDQYMITQNTKNGDNGRFISLTDHTGNANGRMMVVNADVNNNVLYSATVDNLCASQQYSLFFYAAFAGNSNYQIICDAFGGFKYPKIKMRIRDAASSAIITEMTTADITSTSWNQYGMKWVMPSGFNSVIFELINDGQGGCGNDIAIDDIQFGLCDPVPTVTLVNTSAGCIGSATEFTATLNDAGVIPGAKSYQWQISTDGAAWGDITWAAAQNYTIGNLTANDASKYYRVIVAAQGNIDLTSCRYTSPAFLLNAKITSKAPEGIHYSDNNICSGSPVTLSVQGGELGDGAEWRWYTNSCGEVLAGVGTLLTVSPTITTTYYVRAEGDCNTTACTQVTVFVNCYALPCKDIKLKAEVISYALVKLNWSLSCDQETSEFILERKDVAGFVAVHKEKGVFDIDRIARYEAFDDLSGAQSDEIFYRIKSISKDGHIDYSSLIKVKLIKSPDKVQVITNPVRTELKVLIEMVLGSDGRFELLDGNGRIAKRLLQSVVAGINYVKMDVSNLPSGTYYFSAMLQGKIYNRKVFIIK